MNHTLLPRRSLCPQPQATPSPTGDTPSRDDSPPIQRPSLDVQPIRHPIRDDQPIGRSNLGRLPRPIRVGRNRHQPSVRR